jgi:hypothetical protein
VLVDVRTIFPRDEPELIAAVRGVVA